MERGNANKPGCDGRVESLRGPVWRKVTVDRIRIGARHRPEDLDEAFP